MAGPIQPTASLSSHLSRSLSTGFLWRLYTADETDGDVIRLFNRRYGREPAEIIRVGMFIYAGPVGEAENRAERKREKNFQPM